MQPNQLLLLDIIKIRRHFFLKIETYAHAWVGIEDKIEFFEQVEPGFFKVIEVQKLGVEYGTF